MGKIFECERLFKQVKSLIISAIIVNFTTAIHFAQQEIQPIDSVLRHQGITQRIDINYSFDKLYWNQSLNPFELNRPLYTDSSTIWLRTELALNYSSFQGSRIETDYHFTSPLYQQYQEGSKFNMVRYILGMAQLTAAGYIAYRHLKKYGFLK